MEAEIRKMWPQVKECWKPPEAGRCKEQILLGDLISDFCPLELSGNFCCFKPPNAWQFVTAAPENKSGFQIKM